MWESKSEQNGIAFGTSRRKKGCDSQFVLHMRFPWGLTRWSMLKCGLSSHAAKPNERPCPMDCRVKPGNDERKIILATPCVRVLPKPSSRKAIRTKSHARVERREAPGRGPRHADGCCHPPTLRAWRAPQKIRLREPPASGALRLPALHHHRGSPPRLSTAAARVPPPLRRPVSATGVLTVSGEDSLS
jgi:hypothetical protein